MGSMREHLSEFHSKAAAHHLAKSAHHTQMAAHFHKLAGSLGKSATNEAQKDTAGLLATMAGMHQEMSQEHADMGTFHDACVAECAKAADNDDLSKRIVPTNVKAIAVPRAGQRAIATQPEPELAKVLGLDEENRHVEEVSLRQ